MATIGDERDLESIDGRIALVHDVSSQRVQQRGELYSQEWGSDGSMVWGPKYVLEMLEYWVCDCETITDGGEGGQ